MPFFVSPRGYGLLWDNYAWTYLNGAGTNGTESLRVGMGMPQSGEFSLAMVKVGADHGAIGPFLYPVIAVVTAITSVLYPIFYRSSEGVSGFLKRWSPQVVKTYVDSIGEWLAALQKSFQLTSISPDLQPI